MVTSDPADEAQNRLSEFLPGHRVFWDFDGVIGSLYGALPREITTAKTNVAARRIWVVLDPTMRVMNVIPVRQGPERHSRLPLLYRQPSAAAALRGFELQAPILVLPQVFEPELCQTAHRALRSSRRNRIGLHARDQRQDRRRA